MPNSTLVLSLALVATPLAAAQSYPTKPIRFIIPFTSGAATDTVARQIAPKLTEALGQPIVIDNRPGAGGMLGTNVVAKASPDGYTLLMGSPGPLTISPVLLSKIPYDVTMDFASVTLAVVVPFVLVVNPELPAKSVKELIAHAKATSTQLNYASAGIGSVPHFTGELFKLRAGISAVHVPYKGSAPAITDLIGGRVSLFFDNIASALPYVKSGRLRGLAITTLKRSELVPDLPTMIEAGVPGFETTGWNAVIAPAGTPNVVIARLNTEIVKVLRHPETRDKLKGLGTEVVGNTATELSVFLQRERTKWGKVIKDAHITVD